MSRQSLISSNVSKGLKGLPGQVAEVLAKVAKQVQDAEAEADKRRNILQAIEDLQAMRAECKWLVDYDRDDTRLSYRVSITEAARAYCAPTQLAEQGNGLPIIYEVHRKSSSVSICRAETQIASCSEPSKLGR